MSRSNTRSKWSAAAEADHLPRRPQLYGLASEDILNIHDPDDQFAWIELDLPSRHAVFNTESIR